MSLILIEIRMSADEESLLHSSFELVFLSTDDSAAFPVNPVVFFNCMLCYAWSLNVIYFSISAVLLVLWQSGFKSPAGFSHIWVVTVKISIPPCVSPTNLSTSVTAALCLSATMNKYVHISLQTVQGRSTLDLAQWIATTPQDEQCKHQVHETM